MIVRILGSAAGGGVPQWNCGCSNCARARTGEAPRRMQSSLAFGQGDVWVLVNASVDLPHQLASAPALWPVESRATPFRAVLLTDANVDHCAGLGELRQNPGALTVASSAATKALLAKERAYERFDAPPHRWIDVGADAADFSAQLGEEIAARFEVRAYDVPGSLPGYAGRQPWRGAVLAYEVRDRASGAAALFAPVFSDVSDALLDAIGRADVALLDGTFYSDGELRAFGASKGARDLGHLPAGGPDGTIARVPRGSGRRVFIHINNTNPMLDPNSEAYAAVRAAGFEVGSDGAEFEMQAP